MKQIFLSLAIAFSLAGHGQKSKPNKSVELKLDSVRHGIGYFSSPDGQVFPISVKGSKLPIGYTMIGVYDSTQCKDGYVRIQFFRKP